jgi:hypothetical protein
MATTIHSTEKEFRGPWLLDREALVELDALFDTYFERWLESFKAWRSAAIQAELRQLEATFQRVGADELQKRAEERVDGRRDLHRPAKTAILYFGDDKKVVANSIREIDDDPEVLSQLATGLTVQVNQGSSYTPEATVKVTKEWGVKISVSPSSTDDSRAVFSGLHRWATSHTASPVYQYWLKLHPFQIIVLPGLVVFSLLFAVPSSDGMFKVRGRALAAQGVSAANRDEALTILLALQSGAEDPAPKWNKTALAGYVAFALVTVILAFPPTLVIGIGAGEKRLRAWRSWLRFLFFFIPGAILLPFLLNILANLLTKP